MAIMEVQRVCRCCPSPQVKRPRSSTRCATCATEQLVKVPPELLVLDPEAQSLLPFGREFRQSARAFAHSLLAPSLTCVNSRIMSGYTLRECVSCSRPESGENL